MLDIHSGPSGPLVAAASPALSCCCCWNWKRLESNEDMFKPAVCSWVGLVGAGVGWVVRGTSGRSMGTLLSCCWRRCEIERGAGKYWRRAGMVGSC